MMNFFIKLHISFWIVCSLFTHVASAQNIQETLEFANFQYKTGNYKLALKEYQRVLFFNDGKKLQYIYEQIASSFFFSKNYQKAAYYYELSYKTSKSDSIKTELLFKKASCNILDKKFQLAAIELFNLPDTVSNLIAKRKEFYLAVCYWGMEDFEKAKASFIKVIPFSNKAAKDEITNLFSKKKNLYKPNPKTAQILSIFIPGSGQIYSGDIKNGINSMVLTGGLVMLSIYMTHYYSLFDAVLTVLPWFVRYHQGGYKASKRIAFNKRADKRNKTYQEILKIIRESK